MVTRYVYFIQRGADGPIKIGSADHPERRLAQLQIANPEPLTLLAIGADIDGRNERRIHSYLRAHRIRGEWFHPHADVLQAVGWVLDPLSAPGVSREPAEPNWAEDDDDFNIELLEALEEAPRDPTSLDRRPHHDGRGHVSQQGDTSSSATSPYPPAPSPSRLVVRRP